MFFSIIVPAYNVEEFIDRCIESLLEQDIDDYEVLIINDNSTDKTIEHLQNIKNDKIKIFYNKKNCGLSATRNVGLDNAVGDYIIFVDSDDYVEPNFLLNLKNTIISNNNPDVICVGHNLVCQGTVKKIFTSSCVQGQVLNNEKYLLEELNKRYLSIPACFSIYRRELLEDNGIRFRDGLLHEDELWTPTVILASNTILPINLAYYYYVLHEGSITQKKDKTKNGIDLLTICGILYTHVKEIDNVRLKKLYKNHIAMRYMKAVSMGKLYRKEYSGKVDRFFPIKNVCKIKDIFKAIVFFTSVRLYCKLAEGIKKYGE